MFNFNVLGFSIATVLFSQGLYASSMVDLTDDELSKVQGQALMSLSYISPVDTENLESTRTGSTKDIGFYKLGMEAGSALSKLGFAVMTGGGPGIMEAANRGAKEAGGLSLGCNIVLPKEQTANPYLDKVVEFNHFFVRKVLMFKYSFAFVVLPGGVGTTDEMFEALTLIQTKKVSDFPVILMGKEFWKPLLDLLDTFDREKTASRTEFDSLLVTDSIAEMTEFVRVKAIKRFKLAKELQMKRSKWFFEKE